MIEVMEKHNTARRGLQAALSSENVRLGKENYELLNEIDRLKDEIRGIAGMEKIRKIDWIIKRLEDLLGYTDKMDIHDIDDVYEEDEALLHKRDEEIVKLKKRILELENKADEPQPDPPLYPCPGPYPLHSYPWYGVVPPLWMYPPIITWTSKDTTGAKPE